MSDEWSAGLFSCFGDCGACIYVYCCPACAAGEIYRDGDLGGCFVGFLLFCLLHGCYPCIFTGPLRQKRGIKGSTYLFEYVYIHDNHFHIFQMPKQS